MGESTQAMQKDDSLNPGMLWVGDGEALWKRPTGQSGKACINCHVMNEEYDAWMKGAHHAQSCNDCHVPVDLIGKYATKIEHGWRHSKGFTLQDFHEPIRITQSSLDVVQANCVRCHDSLVSGISAAHVADGETEFGCVHCHGGVGHGPMR